MGNSQVVVVSTPMFNTGSTIVNISTTTTNHVTIGHSWYVKCRQGMRNVNRSIRFMMRITIPTIMLMSITLVRTTMIGISWTIVALDVSKTNLYDREAIRVYVRRADILLCVIMLLAMSNKVEIP